MRLLRGDDDDDRMMRGGGERERVIEGGTNWRFVRTGVNGLKNMCEMFATT